MPETKTTRAGHGRDGLAAVRTENGRAHVQDWSWHCRFSVCAHDGERRLIDGDGGTDHRDRRALSVADVDAGFVDDDHGAADALENDAAGGRRWRCVADHQHVLAGGLQHDVLAGRNGGRRGGEDRDVGDQAPEAAGPDRVVGIALLELDPDLRADRRHDEACRPECRRRARRASPSCWGFRRARRALHHDAADLLRDRCSRSPGRDTCRSNGWRCRLLWNSVGS